MNWNNISIPSIMRFLREVEKATPSLFGEYSVIYSDGEEEIKITYRRLK